MNIPSIDFGLGEDIGLLRDTVQDFALPKSPRARRKSTATTSSPPTSGRSSATWACSA